MPTTEQLTSQTPRHFFTSLRAGEVSEFSTATQPRRPTDRDALPRVLLGVFLPLRLDRKPPSPHPMGRGAGGEVRVVSKFLRLALCLLLSSFFLCSAAEQCPDCDVTEAREAQYDRLLTLTPAQQKTALTRHLVYGLPAPLVSGSTGVSPVVSGVAPDTSEHLLLQKDYLTWYDDDLRTPLWVAYRLTKANIIKQRERLECFRADAGPRKK